MVAYRDVFCFLHNGYFEHGQVSSIPEVWKDAGMILFIHSIYMFMNFFLLLVKDLSALSTISISFCTNQPIDGDILIQRRLILLFC